MPKANGNVDVVVVTYNPGATIADFLASVPAAGAVASITVVDNASSDGAAQAAAADARARFVQTGRNAGYGTAANAGAATGEAPWVLISNADIELAPGAIDALVAVAESDPAIASVGPLVAELDGSVYPSARPLPGIVLGGGHAALGRIWPGNPFSRRYLIDLDPAGSDVDAGWLSGSCMLVRREAWRRVGGFDEQFFMFFEDVDLGRRMGEAGYRNVWTPSARVTHLGGHTWRSDPAPMLAAHHESAKQYLRLAYPRWWHGPARWLGGVFLAARQRAEIAASRREH